jgi:hypothetical protein
MLARFRDWLLARVKARSEAEVARAKERAALAAPEPPGANFVDELGRLLGRADADHSRCSDALDNCPGGEQGERKPGQELRRRELPRSRRPLPFVRGQTPSPHDDLPRR